MKFFAVICITLFSTACSTVNTDKPQEQNSAHSAKTTYLNTAPPIDVLFVSSAYNETITSQALMTELIERGYTVKLITFDDETAKGAFQEGRQITTLKNQLEQARLVSKVTAEKNQTSDTQDSLISETWLSDPTKIIGESQIEKITRSINPKLVITGISHAVQAQISNAFQSQNIPVVAMYNRLLPYNEQPGVLRWLQNAMPVDEVFIPADILIDSTHKLRAFSQSWITVTGLPALPEWQQIVRTGNQKAIRRALNLSREKPTLLFMNNDKEHYSDHMELFMEAIQERPDLQVIVQSSNKSADNTLLSKYPSTDNIRLVGTEWPGTSLISISDMIITTRSYDGTLAALSQIPVMYIAKRDDKNALVDHGLADVATRWSELLNGVHKVIDQNVYATGSVSPMGFPKRPIERTTNRIEAILKRTSNPLKSVQIEKIEVNNSL